jgi:hypothetical protein|tara:strand:- start:547 stop:687 length:141 start_codon:yes stop_codon:yes gene_type:complete
VDASRDDRTRAASPRVLAPTDDAARASADDAARAACIVMTDVRRAE